MIVSESVASAKSDVDRTSVEIDLCAKDFVDLLGAVTHPEMPASRWTSPTDRR
jgi:hypothetical protein